MNWTDKTPTKPGFYVWKETELNMPVLALIHQTSKGLAVSFFADAAPQLFGSVTGLWCRLVPAEEVEQVAEMALRTQALMQDQFKVKLAEEVEKAFCEGWNTNREKLYCDLWAKSRARKVAEGEAEP